MKAGRIATTALATLTLEVYYRYLPLVSHPQSGGSPARCLRGAGAGGGEENAAADAHAAEKPAAARPRRRQPTAALGCKAVWYTSRLQTGGGKNEDHENTKTRIWNRSLLCFRAFVIPLLFVEDMT